MSTSTTSVVDGRGGTAFFVVLIVASTSAGVLGAYLDWIWWVDYHGLMITIAAGAIMLGGGIAVLIGRGMGRRIGLIVLAVGIGLIVGQNIGPSREPLRYTQGGTMTLHLEAPVIAVASGPADCTNVASETEFAVSGYPNMRLDTPEHQSVDVYLDIGDRWEALDDAPRKNGVRLEIMGVAERIRDDGSPSMVVMGATGSSTIQSTFSNEGGSIRFADLVARDRQGFSGEPIDLIGTLEWTCGAAQP